MYIYTVDNITKFFHKFETLYPRNGKGKWSTSSISVGSGILESLVIEARGTNYSALSLRTWAKL